MKTVEFGQTINQEIPEREEFLAALQDIYPPEDVHGLDHALEVEKKVIEVLEIAYLEGKVKSEINLSVLRFAALGHDVGYTVEEKMSADKFEHTTEGSKVVKRIIEKIPSLSSRERAGILILDLTHDDTGFTYPLKTREGKPCLTQKQKRQREEAVARLGFLTELKILREADSSFATGEPGLARTIDFSSRKGLPFFADGSEPLNADMWEVSIAGNLRLCARRAFEDAYTRMGKQMALVGWVVQELAIFRHWRKEGRKKENFHPDPCLILSISNWHENS